MKSKLGRIERHRAPRTFPLVALRILLAVAILSPTIAPASLAQAATRRTDRREIEARQAFAAGKYQEALDLYAELYADKVHPTYLRNVGRCYQNLKQPDKAINAFRDYLRQAKDLKSAERNEIEGYIAEMEALKKEQETAQANAATPAAPPPATQPEAVPLVPPVEHQPASSGVQLTTPMPEPSPPPTPFYKKGWFWGVVGVAVVGGVLGGLYAGGVFSKSSIACTAADGCP